MKICIPVIGKDPALTNLMANDFYQANYYKIFDTEKRESHLFPKATLIEKFGVSLTKNDEDKRIEIIITPNMRAMAYKILVDNDIMVFQAEGHRIDANIQLYEENKLSVFDPFQVECTTIGCSSGSCSTCHTSECK